MSLNPSRSARHRLKWADVRQYRLICRNPDNGHMELMRRFEAANDSAAIDLAERWRKRRAAELWKAYRVVMEWPGP